MIVVQLCLTVGLSFFLLYGATHRKMVNNIRFVLVLVPLFGITLIWNPHFANKIARSLGVGRGADLMLYCWVVLSLIVIFNLYVKIVELQRKIVILVREIAYIEDEIREQKDVR